MALPRWTRNLDRMTPEQRAWHEAYRLGRIGIDGEQGAKAPSSDGGSTPPRSTSPEAQEHGHRPSQHHEGRVPVLRCEAGHAQPQYECHSCRRLVEAVCGAFSSATIPTEEVT